jgi:polyisoprenoid-binding protein YceI
MSGKFLQWVGIAALVGVAGLAVAALALVPARVKVVVGGEDAARGPDPTASLSADVAALHDDVRALAGGLERGLGGLGEALDASETESTANAALLRDTAAKLDAFEHELAELRVEVRRELADLRAALAASRTVVATSSAAAAPPMAANDATAANAPSGDAVATANDAGSAAGLEAAQGAVSPVANGAPASAPAVPPAAESGAKKRGFLSFKLPSDAFAFDRRTRFAIQPALSRVGFDGESTLHDFSGVTSGVEGEWTVCLAKPGEGATGFVKVASASLDTGVAERDENMRTALDTERFPAIEFAWSAFEPELVDAAAQKVRGTARGKFTLHGVTRDFAMKVDVAVDASKRVSVQGEAALDMTSFGMEPPSKLGLIGMEKDVKIWIALVARPVGTADGAEGAGAH